MLTEYFPILMFVVVGLAMGAAMTLVGFFIGPRRPDAQKQSPYECGFESFEDARMRFDVRYYLVAIVFIIFDLEFAFFFPWALVLRELGMAAFLPMLLFLLVLVAGFVYEWKRGALEWE